MAEPKLQRGQRPNHFGPMGPGILGIAGKLLLLWEQLADYIEAKRRNKWEKEKRLTTSYLWLLVILDFWFI